MNKYIGLAIAWMLWAQAIRAQTCTVSLGNDTTLCGGGTVNLSIATQFTFFEDSLRIRYDASQGQTGLVGAAKVYMHSGAEMVPFGGWQYVVGNWGQDDGIGQMRNVGTNLWEITIHPESYYGYPSGSNPNGIFMVFRNANGSQTGKDGAGNDIYLDLSGSNPSSAFAGINAWWKTDAVANILWSDGSTGSATQATASGAWWVQVTDTGGCTAADTVQISISNGPMVDLGPNQTICPGQTALLDAGGGFNSYLWNTGATTQSISVTTSGNYFVTVTDLAGCEGLDLVYVMAQSFPVADFNYSGVGLNYAFSSTSLNAVSQYWDFDNNGTTDATTVNPGHTFPAMGNYPVRLVVENECGLDTLIQTVAVGIVGIEESRVSGFQVFPNPFQHQIHIVGGADELGCAFVLVGLDGRTYFAGTVGENAQINLPELPAGTYLLKLEYPDGRAFTRLLGKL